VPDELGPFAGLFDGPSLIVLFAFLVLPALVLTASLHQRFQQVLTHYLQVAARGGLAGVTAARRLLEQAGVRDVRVVPTGRLLVSDNYNPATRELALSNAVYAGVSLSAVGIAAHEVGHALQHATGYRPARLRRALVPWGHACWALGTVVLAFGLLYWYPVVWVGVGLFACCLVLPAISLLVERDASARARRLALAAGVIQPGEREGVDRVLQAAALTYVAKFVSVWVGIFGLVVFLSLQGGQADELFADQAAVFVFAGALTVLLVSFHARRTGVQAAAPGPGALNNMGNSLAHQGEYAEAVAAFTRALALDPSFADAYANRGALSAHLQQHDAALADLNRALALDPDLLDAYSCRGYLRLGRGEYDAAVADYTQVLRRGGSRAAALRDRGLALLQKGDLDAALADLGESLRLNAGDAVTHNNRGVALARRGDYAAAATELREAIRLAPAFPNPYKHLAWLQATCPDGAFRDGAQAVANAGRALRLADGQEPLWLGVLGAAHAEAGDFAEAVRLQEQCLAEAPPEARADLQARLQLYRAGQPYREGPAAAAVPQTGAVSAALPGAPEGQQLVVP
jgi:Zn-dependent membrane protease YugP/Tfp pilus assembly protein PilF